MEGNLPNRKLDKWSELEEREIINGAPDIFGRARIEECKHPDKWNELEERQIINGATDTAQWSANETYSKWAHTHRSRREKYNRTKPAPLRPLKSPDEVFPQVRRTQANTTPRPVRLPPLVRPSNCRTKVKPYYVNSSVDTFWSPSKTQTGGKLKSLRRRPKPASPLPFLRPTDRFIAKFEDIEDVVCLESSTPELRPPSTYSLASHKFRHDSYPVLGLPRTMSSTTEISGKSRLDQLGTRKIKPRDLQPVVRNDIKESEIDWRSQRMRNDFFDTDVSKRGDNYDT